MHAQSWSHNPPSLPPEREQRRDTPASFGLAALVAGAALVLWAATLPFGAMAWMARRLRNTFRR